MQNCSMVQLQPSAGPRPSGLPQVLTVAHIRRDSPHTGEACTVGQLGRAGESGRESHITLY